jgi:hypothetical protein
VSQAGRRLLVQTVRLTGLGQGLAAGLARWRAGRAVHDPGQIVTDLVVLLALGGDSLADVAVLRAQPELFGPVASDPVVSRPIAALASDVPRALKAIWAAWASAPNGRGRWLGPPPRGRWRADSVCRGSPGVRPDLKR